MILLLKVWYDENNIWKKLLKATNFDTSSLNLAILGTKMMLNWIFLKNPHDEIFIVD